MARGTMAVLGVVVGRRAWWNLQTAQAGDSIPCSVPHRTAVSVPPTPVAGTSVPIAVPTVQHRRRAPLAPIAFRLPCAAAIRRGNDAECNPRVTQRKCTAPTVPHAELRFPLRRAYAMGMPATTDRYWVPADLEQFPEGDGCKYECIDGELLVTPAPRFDHGHALQCLALALTAAIGSPKRVFYGVLGLRPEPNAVVEPDLMVFRDPMSRRTKLDDTAGVAVLVEVLSPSTAKRDRGIKRRFYQRARIAEYWIVDLESRLVERWRPDDARPQVLHNDLTWVDSATDTECHIDLAAFFDEVCGRSDEAAEAP
ncbi:MAG: hypothetical protein C0497_07975 [Gemmatimonas sp.]|nr:hypothetical protein [Gemmatimonas sp.]